MVGIVVLCCGGPVGVALALIDTSDGPDGRSGGQIAAIVAMYVVVVVFAAAGIMATLSRLRAGRPGWPIAAVTLLAVVVTFSLGLGLFFVL